MRPPTHSALAPITEILEVQLETFHLQNRACIRPPKSQGVDIPETSVWMRIVAVHIDPSFHRQRMQDKAPLIGVSADQPKVLWSFFHRRHKQRRGIVLAGGLIDMRSFLGYVYGGRIRPSSGAISRDPESSAKEKVGRYGCE